MNLKIGLFFIGFIALFSCQSSLKSPKTEVLEITYSSQFGMCHGYCHSKAVYNSKEASKLLKAWRDTVKFPTKREVNGISEKKWDSIVSSLDVNEFFALDARIGCPDCADGGASSIEIKTKSKSYKVTYEYGSPPASLLQLESLIKI